MTYKQWIIVAASLFGIGIILGLVFPGGLRGLISEDIVALQRLAELLASLPRFVVALIILARNVSVLLLSFALSPLFCIAPVLSLVSNGLLLGLVSITASQQKSFLFVLAGILPHGVFELPAFIMGEAAALSFGVAVITAVVSKEKRAHLRANLKQNLRYLGLACLLLVPAAIIETWVTPLFIR